MSANERKREDRDESWRKFRAVVRGRAGSLEAEQEIIAAGVSLARTQGEVAACDGCYDAYHPFPPVDVEWDDLPEELRRQVRHELLCRVAELRAARVETQAITETTDLDDLADAVEAAAVRLGATRPGGGYG